MLANNLESDLWTPKDIAKFWKDDGLFENKDERSLRESITDKFKYILKENLQFSDEEIAWFKHERYYVFKNENSPKMIQDLFYLFNARDVMLTPAEEDRLIDILCSLLGIGEHCEDERISRIQDAVKKFAKSAWDTEDEIDENVSRFFREKFFVKVDAVRVPKINLRRDIYISQYYDIVEWKNKYSFIMEYAKNSEENDEVYKTEPNELAKLLKLRKLYKNALSEYKPNNKSHKNSRKMHKEKHNAEEYCYECEELFSSIVKHDLRYIDDKKDAYYYVIKKAFEELSNIYQNTLYLVDIKHFNSLDDNKKSEIERPDLNQHIENKDVNYYKSKGENINEKQNKTMIYDLMLKSLLNELDK